LVQETYVQVLRKPRLLRSDDDLGYLMRVLRNTYYSRYRSEARRPRETPLDEHEDLAEGRPLAQPATAVEAAELATRPPTEPAPEPGRPKLLDTSAFGLPYPDWAEKFGWEPTGRRVDEIDGRRAVTVFYEKNGREIGYTILSGEALPAPEPSAAATRERTPLRYVALDGRTIVKWERDGHTCILSGSGVPATTLLNLAGWKGLGAVPF
ncbi:MAG TPA: hypothetical protein VE270_02730, partial [Thermoleophilaceae bacterium]|nr:hypothetical protein [Thermoleophilaceae bacterium]